VLFFVGPPSSAFLNTASKEMADIILGSLSDEKF